MFEDTKQQQQLQTEWVSQTVLKGVIISKDYAIFGCKK